MRHDGVEELAVEQSGNRLVVAHGADPRPFRVGSIGFPQRAGQRCPVAHGGRTDIDRRHGRGRRQQVDVMIVQTGDQCTAASLDTLGRRHVTAVPDGGDVTPRDHDVDHLTLDLDVSDQHIGRHRCPISSSTR